MVPAGFGVVPAGFWVHGFRVVPAGSGWVPRFTDARENCYRYKIVAVVVYIFCGFRLRHETSSQRISCLVKIRDSFGFSF